MWTWVKFDNRYVICTHMHQHQQNVNVIISMDDTTDLLANCRNAREKCECHMHHHWSSEKVLVAVDNNTGFIAYATSGT